MPVKLQGRDRPLDWHHTLDLSFCVCQRQHLLFTEYKDPKSGQEMGRWETVHLAHLITTNSRYSD